MTDRVTIYVDDRGIADVRMNRPEKRNALDGAMFAGLRDAGEQLRRSRAVRAVVLSGEGDRSAPGSTSRRSRRWPAATPRATAPPTATARPAGRGTNLGQQVA